MAACVQSHVARDTRVTYIHVTHKLTNSHPYALTNSLTYSASLTYLRTNLLTNLLGVRAAVDEFAALHDLELEVHGIVWFVTKPAAAAAAAAAEEPQVLVPSCMLSVEATTATEVVVKLGQVGSHGTR